MVGKLGVPSHALCLLSFCVFALCLLRLGSCEKTPEEWRQWEDEVANELKRTRRQIVWYEGTITCEFPGFCAAVYYEEEDTWHTGDHLLYTRLHCTNTTTLKHSAMVVYQGGDGKFDSNYETELFVAHDCRKDKKVIMNRVNGLTTGLIDRIPDVTESQYLRKNYSIYFPHGPYLGFATDLTFNAYYKWNKYPEDPLNTKWLKKEPFTFDEHEKLLGYKRVYQYEKNVDSYGYELCEAEPEPVSKTVKCEHYRL